MNLSLTTGSEGGTRVSGDARRLREIQFFSSKCRCGKKTKYLLVHLSEDDKIKRTYVFSALNERLKCVRKWLIHLSMWFVTRVRMQMQVIYANQIVSLIFFTLRGLGLYHSRHIIYQAFKLRTSRAANRHSLALRNRRYYPSNRSKTTDSLLWCRVKVRSRERQCSTMALAPFISSIKRHSLDERPVSRPRSALRPDFGLESARTIKVNQPFIRVACYTYLAG